MFVFASFSDKKRDFHREPWNQKKQRALHRHDAMQQTIRAAGRNLEAKKTIPSFRICLFFFIKIAENNQIEIKLNENISVLCRRHSHCKHQSKNFFA